MEKGQKICTPNELIPVPGYFLPILHSVLSLHSAAAEVAISDDGPLEVEIPPVGIHSDQSWRLEQFLQYC